VNSSTNDAKRSFGWSLRDLLAAFVLFLLTAAVVLWQNAHLAVLWDLSYVLDTSARIASGQIPYRDFPLAHAPLTFLIQAAIMRLTGRVFFHHVLYAALVGGLSTILTWRIALHTLPGRVSFAWTLSLLMAAPLTVLGIYCILPMPSYDCDCGYSILLAIYLLQRIADGASRSRKALLLSFAAGAACVLPLFFKQNIGLPFLLAVSAAMLLLVLRGSKFIDSQVSKSRPGAPIVLDLPLRPHAAVLAGIIATLMAAVLLLQWTVGLGNYLHWTIQFAAQRRLPGVSAMVSVYQQPSLLWMLPCVAVALFLLRSPWSKALWTQFVALALLATPFLWTLFSLVIYDDADERGDSLLALWPLLLVLAAALTLWNLYRRPSLRSLLPVIVLAAIHGTLLSQQLWGSTYAIWPLLILLLAEMFASLSSPSGQEHIQPTRLVVLPLGVVIAATLLICGGFYTASEERLSYAQLPDEPVQHSNRPQLRGISVSGPYLPNFEELLRFADASIPRGDGIVILPGEDPFYFVTGRVPQFPVLLFDPATQPYSPARLVEQVRVRNTRWLIVKRELQIKEDPTPQREATLLALQSEFTLQIRLKGYDVYCRP